MTAIEQKLSMKKQFISIQRFYSKLSFKTGQAFQILILTKRNKVTLQILHNYLKPLFSFFHSCDRLDIAMQNCEPHAYFQSCTL